ncbi:LysR family transcriptional regulator [Dongia soli]|uniref:LysR family transcriptional regulator n=1 Tax=Dongia soli TaxID=600628 RepID=A0ABU5EEC7_9PROT|nr:LysR family transcriptional regulator [Dongia soli]MDY0884657.1 LysR family transcriptional regulator [Dongia soli]
MQAINWNDLRYILAIARGNSLAAAARLLGVDETTVSRRLSAVEKALEARLFVRAPGGRLLPSEAGEVAMGFAEQVEQDVNRLHGAVAGKDAAAIGKVRLTSVPILVNSVLLPAMGLLQEKHRGLQIELVADMRYLSLTKRETDIALRLGRPRSDVGAAVLTRKVGLLAYAVYAPAAASAREAAALPWITYDESMAQIPQAKWLMQMSARDHDGRVPLAVNDPESIVAAVRAGLGKSLLPIALVKGDPAFRRLKDKDWPALPEREIWLLIHPDQRPLARIGAVIDWIETALEQRGMAA